MALTPGTRLGPYEILGSLGAGGMGEVYRARDTRLKRDVAIKLLPEAFANDAERLVRFQREAEVLAALNHPNIAQIHGLEEDGRTRALVLEIVEGPTLADRIARGAIALDEALPIARQVANALESAHERGIVHRDLKPANIKLAPDGTVKVLDFGLAKAVDHPPSHTESSSLFATAGLSHSPTMVSPLTGTQRVILGTAAYMSPEQAKGATVDHRSDIFSFGVVLYEMLSGHLPFPGTSAPEMVASIIVSEPDFARLPAATPPRLQELVQRCLQKHAKNRWQAIGDLRYELDRIAAAPERGEATRPAERRTASVAAAAAVLASLITGGIAWRMLPQPVTAVSRYVIQVPADHQVRTNRPALALSPDGRQLIYAANGALYSRNLAELEPQIISGTQATDAQAPTFSPDGQFIAFYAGADRTLKRVPARGGTPVTIAKVAGVPNGMSWSASDLFFALGVNGIFRVRAAGGEPEHVVKLSPGEAASSPQVLPTGDVMFTLGQSGAEVYTTGSIITQSIASGRRSTVAAGASARQVGDYLVYVVRSTLFAAPFDLATLQLRGDPLAVAPTVMRGGAGAAQWSVATAGTLAYMPEFGDINGALVLASRDGRVERGITTDPSTQPCCMRYPRVSPDGRWVVLSMGPGQEADLWVHDLTGVRQPLKLTSDGHDVYAVWSRDSRRVFFLSNGELRSIAADGSESHATAVEFAPGAAAVTRTPLDFAPDGRLLVGTNSPDTGLDLQLVSLGTPASTEKWLATAASEGPARFSPDGSFLAYVSDSSGQAEVWVRPFPAPGAPIRVSQRGGRDPVWSRDGRNLYYWEGSRLLSASVVSTSPEFLVSPPSAVASGQFRPWTPLVPRTYDAAPDGRLVLIQFDEESEGSGPEIVIVQNWLQELAQTAAAK